jgi:predicted transposase YbfD/YdcC
MDTHEGGQKKTFYQQLQNCPGLDLRDNRGKRHDLAFVLVGLTIALLLKRDGNLSSIHRSLVNKGSELCTFLGIDNQRVVSRGHLPVLLGKVQLSVFEELLFRNYGLRLSGTEKEWFSGDGKELSGSIESGDKRGEALVQLVRHKDGAVLGQHRYNGDKESERPCMRELLAGTGAVGQKITLDALHLCPGTTGPIAQAGGIFLVGLKGNQKELMADMEGCTRRLKPVAQHATVDKGHGRREERAYFLYDVTGEYFDKRWEKSRFSSMVRVERQRQCTRTGKASKEVAYYMTNGKAASGQEFFTAIRKHWSVEVNNHMRDVTLREDQLRTKKST